MKRCCKFVMITFLCVIIALCIPLSSSSHSGRTDGDGGHYDSSTGKYHYHHGYPAHQHKNGVCPYKNKNKTNKSDKDDYSVLWVIGIVVATTAFVIWIKNRGK